MSNLWAALLLMFLSGCANLADSARAGIGIDAATSAVALSGEAVEVNPLIASPAALAGSVAIRLVLTEYVDKLPEPERTNYLSALSSLWLGTSAANLVVLVLASNPAGLIIGLLTGLAWWSETEEDRDIAKGKAMEINTLGYYLQATP